MHMLYNSPSYIVVQFEVPVDTGVSEEASQCLSRGGFEIVDKFARREIFIEGAMAQQFQEGVEALIGDREPSEDELDDFIERYANMGQQPVVMH
ncbi:DUF3567 domain-containing protein [Pelomonas sp. V22]|uniref:BTH_I0359 family protein n=1 Tax=Pelomonas sp. V22 TaxID=2822139 RepID=UPI0024A86A14|nr:DUF3567 domain-containing protein [Pelomonas sp. V22]MDI4634519.1 DUF3567 domain-containing protein [Pelomonas sp. V22]